MIVDHPKRTTSNKAPTIIEDEQQQSETSSQEERRLIRAYAFAPENKTAVVNFKS
jgi:hypothetical protein